MSWHETTKVVLNLSKCKQLRCYSRLQLLHRMISLHRLNIGSNVCACVQSLSHAPHFATSWTIDHQVPLSMGFQRQECWSGLSFPPPGTLSDPGTEPKSLALVGEFFTAEPPGKPIGSNRAIQKENLTAEA